MCLQVDAHVSVAELADSIWQHAQKDASLVVGGPNRKTLSRDFCMVCRGKVLDAQHNDDMDDRALWQVVGALGEQQQVNLQVWTRQRGGCFMVSCSILAIICTAVVGSTCTCGLSLLIVPVLLPLLFILPLFCL